MIVKGVIVDLVHVIYKPGKCTPQRLLESIRMQGFGAKIVEK